MILHCIVCTSEIPAKRLLRNAGTCGLKCQRELNRMKAADDRKRMKGKTCPTCLRYVPRTPQDTYLNESLRLEDAYRLGNAARFA